ncbi:DUF3363 domain-containing protein [Sphingomonas pokkalii]|uniref:DUF3363 domain-containing protein n=1 Tax=Sphingomonas pokkalii TaxID=2175090 RepID=UPI0034A4DA3A
MLLTGFGLAVGLIPLSRSGNPQTIDCRMRAPASSRTTMPGYSTAHVRRLEAMRRAGAGPERQADGSWTIPEDHLDRAEAFARRQQGERPLALTILSSRAVSELVDIEAPTWLDRERELRDR